MDYCHNVVIGTKMRRWRKNAVDDRREIKRMSPPKLV
jgi:hypothetical protein